MELSNLNMIHRENNYCADMITIPAIQTDGKEREAMKYLWRKSLHALEQELGMYFKHQRAACDEM